MHTWRPSKSADYAVGFNEQSEYVRLGVHVTGVPDAEYPWHMSDVMMIRRCYDPGFIPIFRRIAYRTPSGSLLSFPHHGIARYDPNRQPDPRLEGCLMPYGVPWRKPNVVDFWLEPAVSSKFAARHGLPAPFRPWGDWIVKMTEEAKVLDAKEMAKALRESGENSPAKKALQDAQEEAAYRARGEAQYVANQLDAMSSSDYAELQAKMHGWKPPVETKPFVHLAH